MIHQGNPTPDKWWEGGWIFADTTSSLWTQVESVLLPAKKMVITPETRFEYENELGKIFGYPVAEYPMEAMINKEVQTVTYIDATEQKVLSNLFVYPVCCVIAFEFWDEIGTQENWNGSKSISQSELIRHNRAGLQTMIAWNAPIRSIWKIRC